jgi:hypothetical protein
MILIILLLRVFSPSIINKTNDKRCRFVSHYHWYIIHWWYYPVLYFSVQMTPEMYDFTGTGVTVLGMIGVVSTVIIVVTAFRRYYNSPMRK